MPSRAAFTPSSLEPTPGSIPVSAPRCMTWRRWNARNNLFRDQEKDGHCLAEGVRLPALAHDSQDFGHLRNSRETPCPLDRQATLHFANDARGLTIGKLGSVVFSAGGKHGCQVGAGT